MKARLTQVQVEIGALVGIKRRAESKEKGEVDSHGFAGGGAWDMDINGALGEMAYCKARNIFWDATVGTYKEPDCGENVQVRHCELDHGSLIIRDNDSDDEYFVLVTGRSPEFQVRGWILGKEGKREEFKRAPNGRPPAYFVPQSKLRRFKA